MTVTTNRYCERLGLEIPRLEDVLAKKKLKPQEAMIVALLERGGPMTLEAIEARFQAGGYPLPGIRTVRRAWGGTGLIFKDKLGRFGLNLSSRDLDLKVFMIGLRPPRRPLDPWPQPAPMKPVTEPLSLDEAQSALAQRPPFSFSAVRIAAAVLDAAGRPMTFGEVERFVMDLGWKSFIEEDQARRWRSDLVQFDSEGRLVLRREAPGLMAVRDYLRKIHQRAELYRLHDQRSGQWVERRKAERALAREKAAKLRRAILRAFPEDGEPVAVTILDVGERSVKSYWGNTLSGAGRALESYDLLAGLDIRATLESLGLDPDRWRLVDLGPPQKTYRLNRAGRILRITTELLIRGSVGISRPLGDASRLRKYAASEDLKKLARRLESDAKALLAYYQYGILHNSVRLRWGFLNERIGVDWAVEGDTHLNEILEQAHQEGKPVELVFRWAPSWSDPWGRAQRFEVVKQEYRTTILRDATQEFYLDPLEVQAARVVDEGARPKPLPLDRTREGQGG